MLLSRVAAAEISEEHIDKRISRQLNDHRNKYILQGIAFMTAGVMAAMVPNTTALHAEFLIGVILLTIGIFQLVLTLKSRMHWGSIFSACLSITIGLLIVWKPFDVLISIVTLLAMFMTFEGLFELFLAFRFRPLRSWSWMIFSSVVTLLMAAILWIGYPTFDVLYLGWIIAVNLILYGLSLLMLVWGAAS